jgi:hypothetical protein
LNEFKKIRLKILTLHIIFKINNVFLKFKGRTSFLFGRRFFNFAPNVVEFIEFPNNLPANPHDGSLHNVANWVVGKLVQILPGVAISKKI